MSVRPSRRTVIGVCLLGAAGCTRRAPRVAARPSAPDPDPPLRAAAVAREQALILLYDAAALAAPPLAARLAPLRAEHARHLLALDASDTPVGTADAAADLPRLRAAERVAAAAHGDAAVLASRPLAAVLASLSASEASHAGALA